MKKLLQRIQSRIRRYRSLDDDLNRRVYVESRLMAASVGKRPMPTKQELYDWAVRLGVPSIHQQRGNHDH